jgi:hypothetical protein
LAVARPIPVEAPVITAIFPVNLFDMADSLFCFGRNLEAKKANGLIKKFISN